MFVFHLIYNNMDFLRETPQEQHKALGKKFDF